jgi:putative intracellular protease/amidase
MHKQTEQQQPAAVSTLSFFVAALLFSITLLSILFNDNSASAQPEPQGPQRQQLDINSTKVLIVVTSHNVLGKTGYPTGLWLPEMTHPYYALKNAGFDIVVASPKGGNTPIDPYSIPSNPQGTNRDDPMTEKFLHSPEDVSRLNNTVPLANINSKDYSAVVFPGGNGGTYDFPWSSDVNRIASSIYEQGGIVAAVCHGPAALLNATLSDGSYLIKGMKITGFSNEEEAITEILIGAKNVVPIFLENELPKRGAVFEKTYVHEPLVVVSGDGGRLITGQNPESAMNVGEKVVEMLTSP